jgi:hypothetical protein
MLFELNTAFISIRTAVAAPHQPSLERMATARTPRQVDDVKAQMGNAGSDGFRLSLVVDIVYPAIYAGIVILAAGATSAWIRRRRTAWAALLASLGAWLATAGFLFDHAENLFLWREITSSHIPQWLPTTTWSVNRLKWGAGLAGGFCTLAAIVVLVGLYCHDRLRHRSGLP